MYALIPMLSSLLVAVGGITSATVFHPLLWALVGGIAGLVQRLLFPMILLSTAFSLMSHFSADLPFPRLGNLLRQGVITLLALFFIVFSGFMVVRGAIAPVTDGSYKYDETLSSQAVLVLEVVVGGSS